MNMYLYETSLWTDSFLEQLIEDSAFLKAERRLSTQLVDKLILQLNRIYPQILSDKEATKVHPHTHTHGASYVKVIPQCKNIPLLVKVLH